MLETVAADSPAQLGRVCTYNCATTNWRAIFRPRIFVRDSSSANLCPQIYMRNSLSANLSPQFFLQKSSSANIRRIYSSASLRP